MTRTLRLMAMAVVLLAIVDPAFTWQRAVRPVVVVLAATAADQSLADEITASLDNRFEVLRSPFAQAAATVIAGASLPAGIESSRVFAVLPDPRTPRITALRVPERVSMHSAVPVDVTVRGGDAVTLEVNGTAVDRRDVDSGADGNARVQLSWVPANEGVAHLRVYAGAAHADVAVDVLDDRARVLFYDPRPSWISTFVRRTAERDPRLDVASRVVISREIDTSTGNAPASLRAGLADFEVIAVGAPEQLGPEEVTALESFLHGGGVVLLLREQTNAGALQRMLPFASTEVRTARPTDVLATRDSLRLRGSTFLVPAELPAGLRVIAADSGRRPVLWRFAAGAGKLWVSGALDAWRFRDPDNSDFEQFWPAVIAQAAADALPEIEIRTHAAVSRSGDEIVADITLRDVALADASASSALVQATLADDAARVWPVGPAGVLQMRTRAPAQSGVYRIDVAAEDKVAAAPIIVVPDALQAAPYDSALLRVWTQSRGGRLFMHAEIGELADSIAAVTPSARAAAVTRPMRSPWWIVPFALALSAEWLQRRRRGMA